MTFQGRHPPFKPAAEERLWRDFDLSGQAGAEMLADRIVAAWRAVGAEAEVVVERVPLKVIKANKDPLWRARLVAVRPA